MNGLRRSEVLALRWSDVDLGTGELKITRGRLLIDGKRTVEGKPKTDLGMRALWLSAERPDRTADAAEDPPRGLRR